MGRLKDGATPAHEKKLPKAPKNSKRLEAGAKAHVKGEHVEARRHADGSIRFSRLNDEGTVSAWRIDPPVQP